MEISRDTARRFILGRSGLWPGRRWAGARGTEAAMRALEHLQLDPLLVMGRAQDLILQARVADYHVDDWAIPTYERRRFFDWGGWLAVRPMEELPYWRSRMRRDRERAHWREVEQEHHDAIVEMRAALRERGLVANRDFAMSTRKRTDSYRGRKDSAVALYYLWRIGEAMVHHRERFERVYAPTEAIAPARYLRDVDDAEADAFLWRKEVAFYGLTSFTGLLQEDRAPHAAWSRAAIESGEVVEVRVDGWRKPRWALADDLPDLRTLEAGRVPRAWRPAGPTTEDEATFLSPLDPVSARKRAAELFDFDYIWEVYTPAPKRRFGYYALPVLWGDRLVARFDGRFEPSTRTLRVLGLWLEDGALVDDEAFIEAFTRGMARFLGYLEAACLDVSRIEQPRIRRRLEAETPAG